MLEIVEEIAEHSTIAAVECFKASPAGAAGRFAWASFETGLGGLGKTSENSRRVQAYYSLESKASQEALFKIEGGLTLDSVAHTLRLYVEGLTGRSLHIASLASIPDEAKIGDGKTIFLPSVVAEFEDERENFRLFKVLAAHGAGQIEFLTLLRDAPATLGRRRPRYARRFKHRRLGGAAAADDGDREARGHRLHSRAGRVPRPDLATRLFTTIENGRIDYLLRSVYRGIRRDLDFVRARLNERRPDVENIPPKLVPFELLFQLAICGGATEAKPSLPGDRSRARADPGNYVFRDDASVADSLMATRHVYDFFVESPTQSDTSTDDSASGDEGSERATTHRSQSPDAYRLGTTPTDPGQRGSV